MLLWLAIASVVKADQASLERWVTAHATPLRPIAFGNRGEDLQVVKKAIGQASVVGFGEPWHLQHEYLIFRNRLFQYLVEEAGITAYAAETGYAKSIAVDDYVLGRGALTKETVRSVFSFSGPLPENRALIEWIREYNMRPSTRRPIRFYGIDPGPVDHSPHRYNEMGEARFAAEAVLRYVNAVAPERFPDLSSRFKPVLLYLEEGPRADYSSSPDWSRKLSGYYSAPPQARESITTAIADLIGLFERNRVEWISRTSRLAFERAYHTAIVLRQADSQFRAALSRRTEISDEREREHPGLSGVYLFRGRAEARDATMAENVKWVLEQEGPRGRIFLFAASAHLQAAPSNAWGPFAEMQDGLPPFATQGTHLRSMLGNDFVVIGGICHHDVTSSQACAAGPLRPWGSTVSDVYGGLPAFFEKTKLALVFLDLREMPQSEPTAYFSGRYGDYFDAVVSFRNISTAGRASSVCNAPRDVRDPSKYAGCPLEPDLLPP